MRAFGRRRGNIGRELAKNRDLRFLKYRDAHKQIFNVNVSFRLETVRLEFQPSGSQVGKYIQSFVPVVLAGWLPIRADIERHLQRASDTAAEKASQG